MKESWLTWEFCLLSALQKRQLPCHHEVVQTVVKQTNKQTRKKYIYYSSSVLIPVFFQNFSLFFPFRILFFQRVYFMIWIPPFLRIFIHSFITFFLSPSFPIFLGGKTYLYMGYESYFMINIHLLLCEYHTQLVWIAHQHSVSPKLILPNWKAVIIWGKVSIVFLNTERKKKSMSPFQLVE